jgi:hypothetical protein
MSITTGGISGWARSVAEPAPTAAPLVTPTGDRAPSARRKGLAAALVAQPLAMTAWFLVEPAILPREEPALYLASVSASPGRYLAATAMVALAGALALPAALAIGRLLRPQLPRIAALLVAAITLSGLGLWSQLGYRTYVATMVSDGVTASAVESHAAFQSSVLFDVLLLPGLAAGAVATLVLLVALLRTRIVERWVPFVLLAGTVFASGEFPDVVTVGGAALAVVGNLRLAKALLVQR